MSTTIRGYVLNDINEPANWSSRERTLLETIVSKLPDATATITTTQHVHDKLMDNTDTYTAVTVNASGALSVGYSLFLNDDIPIKLGNSISVPDATIEWDTAPGVDSLLLNVDTGNIHLFADRFGLNQTPSGTSFFLAYNPTQTAGDQELIYLYRNRVAGGGQDGIRLLNDGLGSAGTTTIAATGTNTQRLKFTGNGFLFYDTSSPIIYLCNSTTGSVNTDGTLLSVSSSGLFTIKNQEQGQNVEIYSGDDGEVQIKQNALYNTKLRLSNSGTGHTATDGLLITQESDGDASINLLEGHAYLSLIVNSRNMIQIQSSNNVLIDPTGFIFLSINGNNQAIIGDSSITLQSGVDLYTTSLTNYFSSSTVTGWSSFVDDQILYRKVGKDVFVWYTLSGETNSATTSFTLPFARDANTHDIKFSVGYSEDSGNYAESYAKMTASSSTVTFYLTSGSAWTAGGVIREVTGYLHYVTA